MKLPPRLPQSLFGTDLRSLALFRATLGAVLFADLCSRLGNVAAFYSDAGVLPRAALSGERWRIALHLANGQPWFAAALLVLEALAALALLLGWRTRLATLLCFLLQASLLNRNELVLLPGDTLLVCLLFWGLFLPLQARWSVDASLSETAAPADEHRSWASAGLLLQLVSVYFFGAVLQSGPEWWPEGSALWYALQADTYATPLARWLSTYPDLLHALSLGLWLLQWLLPLLAFAPLLRRPLRFLALLSLTLLQLGALLCLHLGLTPWVMLAALTILADGWIWDALDRRAQRRERARGALPLRIYYDRDCGFCLKMCLLLQTFLLLPRAQIAPAQDQARARALLEANYSWVIIDHDDHAFLKWPAFVLLLRRSPLLAWLGWLLSGRWAVPIGNTVYDFVGRHRGAFGKLSAALLPRRRVRFETGPAAQAVAGLALLLVLVWNLAAVHWLPPLAQHLLRPPLRLLRLDQEWTLFAPAPPRESGWFVLPGELADGSQRDLLRPELPAPGYERPRDAPSAESGSRWQRYRESLMARPSGEETQLYGRYECRQWNASHPATQALRSLKLVYVLWTTPPPGGLAVDAPAPAAEQRVLARLDCAEQTRNPP